MRSFFGYKIKTPKRSSDGDDDAFGAAARADEFVDEPNSDVHINTVLMYINIHTPSAALKIL